MTKFSELLKEHETIELDDPVVQADKWFLVGMFAGIIVGGLIGFVVGAGII